MPTTTHGHGASGMNSSTSAKQVDLASSRSLLTSRDWLVSHGSISALAVGLIAFGSIAVGWLPPLYNVRINPVLEALRTTEQGQLLGRIAVILGGALLVHAWLVLGLTVLRDHRVSLRQLWALLTLWCTVLMFIPPLFSRDVYSYIAQGRLLVRGLDPYVYGVGALPGWFQLGPDPMWAESPTPYGPLFLAMEHAVAAITPTSPTLAVLLFKILCVVGIALMATGTARLARMHGIDDVAATWLAVLNPLVILHLLVGVHNDSLMIGLLLWAFVFALDSRRTLATLCLICAVGIKPIALVALPFLVLAFKRSDGRVLRLWRDWLVTGASVLLGVWALGAAQGVGVGWIGALSTPSSVATLLSPPTALAELVGLVTNLFGVDSYSTALGFLRTAGLVAALVIIARLALAPSSRSAVRGAGLAFTALIALSPVVQPWYLLWALALIAVSGLARGWHLRLIVAGTAMFVMYSLAEVNVVTDSTINVSDYLSVALSVLVVVLIAVASPSERALAWGTQFAHGLQPQTEEQTRIAHSRIVQGSSHVRL